MVNFVMVMLKNTCLTVNYCSFSHMEMFVLFLAILVSVLFQYGVSVTKTHCFDKKKKKYNLHTHKVSDADLTST